MFCIHVHVLTGTINHVYQDIFITETVLEGFSRIQNLILKQKPFFALILVTIDHNNLFMPNLLHMKL